MKLLFIASAIACMAALSPLAADAQAKKPKLMLMPSDSWCYQNGYFQEFTNQGRTKKEPDYVKAFTEDPDLSYINSKIDELMIEREFPLVDMMSVVKDIDRTALENEMTVSKTSGAEIAETAYDRITTRAKADMVLQLQWNVIETGPKRSVRYNLRAVDAYSNKPVAVAEGTSSPSFSAETAVMLEEAVIGNMDQFFSQLQQYFDDLGSNGREISINIHIFDNGSGLSFEDEYGGEELTDIIDEWMADNTVNHRYGMNDATETRLTFDQVRIPLYRENGMPMDTRHFARQLTRMLGKAPYNIPAKIQTKGLGRVDIILGEK